MCQISPPLGSREGSSSKEVSLALLGARENTGDELKREWLIVRLRLIDWVGRVSLILSRYGNSKWDAYGGVSGATATQQASMHRPQVVDRSPLGMHSPRPRI